jgi:hypothetical protein
VSGRTETTFFVISSRTFIGPPFVAPIVVAKAPTGIGPTAERDYGFSAASGV